MPDTIAIRPGSPADEDALLALFDEAVAWMVARGQSGPWGDRPSPSGPRRAGACTRWRSTTGLWIAERDGAPVGALIVGERPAHVHPIGAPELYVELLISSRAHAGKDIGGRLVRHADALAAEAGVPVLRVDCWAGAPTLVGLVRAPGLRPRGHVRLPRLDRPGLREADPGRAERRASVGEQPRAARRTSGRRAAASRSSAAAASAGPPRALGRELGHARRADVARAALEPVREAAHLLAVVCGERGAQLGDGARGRRRVDVDELAATAP